MSRYQKYTKITHSLLISKYSISGPALIPVINGLEIQAGHFKAPKIDDSTVHRGLLVANLSSSPKPSIQWFTHGKKMKETFTLTSTTSSNAAYWALDKILNLLLPNIGDLTPMLPKNSNANLNYFFRLNKPFELPGWEGLFPIFFAKRSNYFPFFFKVMLKPRGYNSNIINRSYLRMYRIPFHDLKWTD